MKGEVLFTKASGTCDAEVERKRPARMACFMRGLCFACSRKKKTRVPEGAKKNRHHREGGGGRSSPFGFESVPFRLRFQGLKLDSSTPATEFQRFVLAGPSPF